MSSQSLLACLTIMCWYCIILQAARILVQLMCKHEYDARYQALDDKLYIAQQYFPLVGLVSFVEFSDSDSTFSVIRTYRQNVMLILVGTGFCSCARNFLQGFVPFQQQDGLYGNCLYVWDRVGGLWCKIPALWKGFD